MSNTNEKLFLASLGWRSLKFRLSHFLQLLEHLQRLGDLDKVTTHVKDDFLKALLKQRELFQRRFDKEQEWCFKNQVHLACPGDGIYPEKLCSFSDSPTLLSYYGVPCWRSPGVAVVGSREPEKEVMSWMSYNLDLFLKKSRPLLISGGARGVDQMGHSLALKHKLPTLAFLPSGSGEIYPASFRDWLDLILESHGAVVSSVSPFEKMHKFYFHRRNQYIARMSDLVFVVEAKKKSGSYLTGRLALEEGKQVATLPFFPHQKGRGSLDLLADGANMVRDYEDLLVLWGFRE